MKYTKKDITNHAEFVHNSIISCKNVEQLKIAQDMIDYFIIARFKDVINPIELNVYEDYLMGAIEIQNQKITLAEYPTFERNLN